MKGCPSGSLFMTKKLIEGSGEPLPTAEHEAMGGSPKVVASRSSHLKKQDQGRAGIVRQSKK